MQRQLSQLVMLSTSSRQRLSSSIGLGLFVCALISLGDQAALAEKPDVTAVTFSPDANFVLSGSQSGVSIRSWPGLAWVRNLAFNAPNLHDLRFSPDGSQLAVAGGHPGEDGIVTLFSWPKGDRIATLDGHFDSVLAVRWMDDDRLVSASLDHRLVVWDVPKRKAIKTYAGHARGISSLETLPNVALIASGGIDHSLRIWSTEQDEAVRNLAIHARPINGLARRPSQEGLPMLASASDDRTVRFWQPTIGRMVRFAKLPSIPREIAWNAEGSVIVACCDDGKVYTVDPISVRISEGVEAIRGWANAVAVHPTEPVAVVGGTRGQLVPVSLPEIPR